MLSINKRNKRQKNPKNASEEAGQVTMTAPQRTALPDARICLYGPFPQTSGFSGCGHRDISKHIIKARLDKYSRTLGLVLQKLRPL